MKKKKILVLTVISILLVGFVICSTAVAAGKEEEASEVPAEVYRIGIIGPMTGWATVYGENLVKGVKYAIDEYSKAGGTYSFKLFVEDTKGEVEVMNTKLDLLKERDKVNIIIGPSLGHEGMASADWASRNPDTILMTGYSAPEDLTMRKHTSNLIRAGWTGSQVIFNFGQFCAKDLGYKRIVMVGQDYAYPWGQAAGFIRGFIENGGEEVFRIWHPVELLDFSSIMGQLQKLADKYDAVLYNGSGAQAIAFFKQWNQYGLDKIYPQLLGGANVTDVPIIPELGEKAVGIYASMHYVETLDSPANKKFREGFYEMFNEYPDAISLQGYDTMRVIIKAIESLDGKIDDVNAFINAILAVRMPDSPRGPFYFDQYGQAVQNIYIKKLEKIDGKLQNIIVKTFEEVSQFGPYVGMEEKYMAQPPNTRDYPYGTRSEYMAELEKYFGSGYVKNLEKNGGWASK